MPNRRRIRWLWFFFFLAGWALSSLVRSTANELGQPWLHTAATVPLLVAAFVLTVRLERKVNRDG